MMYHTIKDESAVTNLVLRLKNVYTHNYSFILNYICTNSVDTILIYYIVYFSACVEANMC